MVVVVVTTAGQAGSPGGAGRAGGIVGALDAAFAWACGQRAKHPDAADIWGLRRCWTVQQPRTAEALTSGAYRFSLLDKITNASGETMHVWAARDAVVLKALTATLQAVLPVSVRCTHVKGHGGLKGAVRAVADALVGASDAHAASAPLGTHAYVFRTDVKSYYDSIDHGHLIEKLKRHVTDERVLGLVRQYCNRTAERGGNFTTVETKGISRGCSLSPLIGAFYLGDLDARLEAQARREGLLYVRYMDDILVLAPTRWKLRRAVAAVNQELEKLGLGQALDKTFIGPVTRGFDFLGYHFSRDALGPVRLGLAAKTIANYETKLQALGGRLSTGEPSGAGRPFRLYEQPRQTRVSDRPWPPRGTEPPTAASTATQLNNYTRRFMGWARGGLRHASSLLHVHDLDCVHGCRGRMGRA